MLDRVRPKRIKVFASGSKIVSDKIDLECCPVCGDIVTDYELWQHFYRHFVDEGVRVKDTSMSEAEYNELKQRVKGVERNNEGGV